MLRTIAVLGSRREAEALRMVLEQNGFHPTELPWVNRQGRAEPKDYSVDVPDDERHAAVEFLRRAGFEGKILPE